MKVAALVLLGLVSLLAPLVERWATGRVQDMSAYDIAATLISISLMFWWYHLDKRERNYAAGPLMNGGILVLAMIAFPVYFVRTRGWKKGLVSTILAGVVLAISLGLGELGEWIGSLLP